MTTKFVQPGEVIDYTAGANKTSGQPVLIGTKLGVCLADIANGSTGPVAMSGVYTVTKLSTDVVTQGAALYWDNANSRLTTTASGNTYAGYAFAAAGNGVTTVNIKLNG